LKTKHTPFLRFEEKIAFTFSTVIIILQFVFLYKESFTNYSAVIPPVLLTVLFLLLVYYSSLKNSLVLEFLRVYIHIPYYGILFTAFQTYLHKLNPNDYDVFLLKADLTLIGTDLTVWMEKFISNILTEVLTISYFSYYVLPTVSVFLFYFIYKKDKLLVREYVTSIVIGWYAALIIYALMPAAGPDMAFPEHYKIPLQGLSPLTNYYLDVLFRYLREDSVRNTFPSMHFCILLITNWFAYRFNKKYFYLCTLPLGILLGIATIYLRQHYFVDLLGSFPMAAVSVYVSKKLV
jgi:membrane-associated phospholipid phosphatase